VSHASAGGVGANGSSSESNLTQARSGLGSVPPDRLQ
jgi:hypothetical protein